MREIEIKICEINPEQIIQKLLELGAEDRGECLIRSRSYDFNDGRIGKSREHVRIRSVGDKMYVAYKRPHPSEKGYKMCDEWETEVEDGGMMHDIFTALGLKPKSTIEKKRHSFRLNNTLVEIDTYPNIPPLMEIEGTEEGIAHMVELLEVTPDHRSSWSAGKVIYEYGKDPTFCVFEDEHHH